MKIRFSKLTLLCYDTPEYQFTRVPKELIDLLGLTNQISNHARMNEKYVFIAEAQDWLVFASEYVDFYGHEPKLDVHKTTKRSRIWNYPYYDQKTTELYDKLKSRIIPRFEPKDQLTRLMFEKPRQMARHMRKQKIEPENPWEKAVLYGYKD